MDVCVFFLVSDASWKEEDVSKALAENDRIGVSISYDCYIRIWALMSG